MKIILATDGSQYAEEAAWLLAHLPHSEKLELTVLFISNVPNLHGATNIADLMKRLAIADKEKAASVFAHLKSIFDGANASLELVVGEGHVGTRILREAEVSKCDLIVLGAVGHSLFERMFGSTSDFVATHARCSVLVVRPTGLNTAKRPIDVCKSASHRLRVGHLNLDIVTECERRHAILNGLAFCASMCAASFQNPPPCSSSERADAPEFTCDLGMTGRHLNGKKCCALEADPAYGAALSHYRHVSRRPH